MEVAMRMDMTVNTPKEIIMTNMTSMTIIMGMAMARNPGLLKLKASGNSTLPMCP
jgi:hypothetical protein